MAADGDLATGSTAHLPRTDRRLRCRRRRADWLRVCFHASERRIDIWVARAKPVAERRPQELACGGGRGALHDEVLAVEEVGRILRVRGHRAEAGKWREHAARP